MQTYEQQTYGQPAHVDNKPKISTKAQKRVNQVFVGLSLGMVLYTLISTGDWTVIPKSFWLLLNVYFLIVKKDAKISFLRCRVCLVYVFFGFVAFGNLLIFLIAVAFGAVNEAAEDLNGQTWVDADGNTQTVDYDAGTGRTVVLILLVAVFISLGQGISWVVYTCKLTEKHWDRIHNGYSRV